MEDFDADVVGFNGNLAGGDVWLELRDLVVGCRNACGGGCRMMAVWGEAFFWAKSAGGREDFGEGWGGADDEGVGFVLSY